jgi:hypothetical protein
MANFLKPPGTTAAGYTEKQPYGLSSVTVPLSETRDIALYGGAESNGTPLWVDLSDKPSAVAKVEELAQAGGNRVFRVTAMGLGRCTLEARVKDAHGALWDSVVLEVAGGGPARDCALPASSPYAKWPAPLIETLCRSYRAHGGGYNNLPEAFGKGEPPSFEEALNRVGGTIMNAIKEVYDRVAKVSGLWPFIFHVHNTWITDNKGFRFSVEDAGAKGRLSNFLDSSPQFCRDTNLMQWFHQDGYKKHPIDAIIKPSHQCWREVVNGGPGLHICLPKEAVLADCSIHVDPHQIVQAKNKDCTCDYDSNAIKEHAKDLKGLIEKTIDDKINEEEAIKKKADGLLDRAKGLLDKGRKLLP